MTAFRSFESNHFLGSFGLPTIYYKKKLTTEYTYNKSTLKKYNDLKPNNSEAKVPEFIKYAAAMVLIISATFFFNNEYEKYSFQQKIILEQENRQRTIERVENAIFDFGSIPAAMWWAVATLTTLLRRCATQTWHSPLWM